MASEALTLIRPEQAVALVAGARRSLDEDPGLARVYLDRLERLFHPAAEAAGAVREPLAVRGAAATGKGGLAGWQVRRVTEQVEARLASPLMVEDLAAAVRLSTGHFCRAFKASMGETPHAYVIRQRVRRAQVLMLETEDSLSQIACACGLTDQSHLTRLFRKIVGTTPLAWRRSRQGQPKS